ncbi:hypothetical protein [Paludibacterium paludis]|uniref:Protein kinase domain-containing protein n=1 Tax=Paludibacterium paludis TaxID=1225769 RepID=A0A918NXN4_9NEIS|nr:hypothetical protein [Paludibacterium paludis]GGY02555.1 hypothetical protein GCM10011289_00870 [Paludibacterium paludis]
MTWERHRFHVHRAGKAPSAVEIGTERPDPALAGANKRIVHRAGGYLSLTTTTPANIVPPLPEGFFEDFPHLVAPRRVAPERLIMRDAGQDLQSALCKGKCLRPEQWKPLAEELDRLHRAGFVHGDIKPENLALGPDKANGGEAVLHLIDCDGICPVSRRPEFFTPGYTPALLLPYLDASPQHAGITADEHAFVYSVMLATIGRFGLSPSEHAAFLAAIRDCQRLNRRLTDHYLDGMDLVRLASGPPESRQNFAAAHVYNASTCAVLERWIKRYIVPGERRRIRRLLMDPVSDCARRATRPPTPLASAFRWK